MIESAKFAHTIKNLINAGPLWLWAFIGAFFIIFFVALFFAGLATYIERKVAADFQDRIGPNRVGRWGLLQFIADAIKMLGKEDFLPLKADRFLFFFSPFLAVTAPLSAFAVLPFGEYLIGGDVNVGLFYILAVTTLVVPALLLGAWSSANKWSLLGGMRAGAQLVSYEIPVTLSMLPAIIISGTLQIGSIVEQQNWSWSLEKIEFFHFWNVFHNPFSFISFFLLFIAGVAEANRLPFDLPEAESELVSGYNTEFATLRWGLFMIGEYSEIFVMCSVGTALYLGGWQLPLINISSLPLLLVIVIEFLVFLAKVLFLVFVVMWLRWTFPRLRVDQLMEFCWKGLVPISIFCVIGTLIWMLVFNGNSLAQLIMRGLN